MVTSHRAILAVFPERRSAAARWFLVLPLALYAAAIAAAALPRFADVPRPDLRDVATLSRDAFAVTYPGNWRLASAAGGAGGMQQVVVGPTDGGCRATVIVAGDRWPDASSALEERRAAIDAVGAIRWEPFARWGGHAGTDLQGFGELDKTRFEVALFAAEHDGRILLVEEAGELAWIETMRPGLALIRRSFAWR